LGSSVEVGGACGASVGVDVAVGTTVAVRVLVGVAVARGVTVGGPSRGVGVENRVGVAKGVSVWVGVLVGRGVPGVIVGEGVWVGVRVGMEVEVGRARKGVCVVSGPGVKTGLLSWIIRPRTVAVGKPRDPPGGGPRSQAPRSSKGTPTKHKPSASRHGPPLGRLGPPGNSGISGCFISWQYNTVQSPKSKLAHVPKSIQRSRFAGARMDRAEG
jgi:hypothetical protein